MFVLRTPDILFVRVTKAISIFVSLHVCLFIIFIYLLILLRGESFFFPPPDEWFCNLSF